jgi:DNA-binding XRE family transcriptional regulator
MTADDFKSWRKTMGLSQDGAATALGLSNATIQNYERGIRLDGKPAPIPRTTALACAALFHRIEPWEGIQ